jgi:hypothetical protein
VFLMEVMQPGRESDHIPPYSAEVKMRRTIMCTSPYVFMGWCVIFYLTTLSEAQD